jgi:hypothetical protein
MIYHNLPSQVFDPTCFERHWKEYKEAIGTGTPETQKAEFVEMLRISKDFLYEILGIK